MTVFEPWNCFMVLLNWTQDSLNLTLINANVITATRCSANDPEATTSSLQRRRPQKHTGNLFNRLSQARTGVSLLSFHHSGCEESLTSSVYTQVLDYDFIHLNKSSKRKLNKNSTRIIQTFSSLHEKCDPTNATKNLKIVRNMINIWKNVTMSELKQDSGCRFGICWVINISIYINIRLSEEHGPYYETARDFCCCWKSFEFCFKFNLTCLKRRKFSHRSCFNSRFWNLRIWPLTLLQAKQKIHLQLSHDHYSQYGCMFVCYDKVLMCQNTEKKTGKKNTYVNKEINKVI